MAKEVALLQLQQPFLQTSRQCSSALTTCLPPRTAAGEAMAGAAPFGVGAYGQGAGQLANPPWPATGCFVTPVNNVVGFTATPGGHQTNNEHNADVMLAAALAQHVGFYNRGMLPGAGLAMAVASTLHNWMVNGGRPLPGMAMMLAPPGSAASGSGASGSGGRLAAAGQGLQPTLLEAANQLVKLLGNVATRYLRDISVTTFYPSSPAARAYVINDSATSGSNGDPLAGSVRQLLNDGVLTLEQFDAWWRTPKPGGKSKTVKAGYHLFILRLKERISTVKNGLVSLGRGGEGGGRREKGPLPRYLTLPCTWPPPPTTSHAAWRLSDERRGVRAHLVASTSNPWRAWANQTGWQ